MQILSPNETTRLFQMRAEQNNDKPLTLPLIAISRDPNIELLSTKKKALTYDAAHIEFDDGQSALLNGIPIQINYQLDIYTREFAEADEYVRNFVFNIINRPKIDIVIPYNNANIMHRSTLLLESSVSDSSDIPERLIPGQFTRMTLRLYIDDAWYFSVPILDNWNIEDTKDIEVIDKE